MSTTQGAESVGTTFFDIMMEMLNKEERESNRFFQSFSRDLEKQIAEGENMKDGASSDRLMLGITSLLRN